MRLKSYFAGTVEAAMALAREELGPEALLVHSKKATPETRHIGNYEVVFALPPAEPSAPPPPPPPEPNFRQVFAGERDAAIERLTAELSKLRSRVEGMSGMIGGAASVPARVPASWDLAAAELQDQEVDADLAGQLAGAAAELGGTRQDLLRAIEARITVDPTLGVKTAPRRAVALAGPPGAGKTTMLVKLATRYGLTARRSVHLISTDVFRIGAAEQLRLYASILGIGFQAVETPLALAQALEEQRRKDLILIDTPGWGRRNLPEMQELAAYMADDPEIDVHLVLPAPLRGRDLERTADRYSAFRPAKLIFTRLDETERHGPMLNLCCKTGKPISFLSSGDQIPEDVEAATRERISELILGRIRDEAPAGVFAGGGN